MVGRTFSVSNWILGIIGLVSLGGCQLWFGPEPTSSVSAIESPPGVVIAGRNSVFEYVPSEQKDTSRQTLFQLVDALDAAYSALNFAPPYPRIRIGDSRYELLGKGRLAIAVIDELGEESIYFNRDYLNHDIALDRLVLHELAHLKAWRTHGTQIKSHGPEFRQICRAVSERTNCNEIER